MEPPPPPPSDSASSSPRSHRAAESPWDHSGGSSSPALPPKLRLMCSYGGHIVPRPHDKSLCYVGGETRIVVADRHAASLPALSAHLSKTLLHGRPFTLKYQLPNEDLDSLITVSTDEDLENMIDEHDRTVSHPSLKPSRLRLFLFPLKPESAQSNIGPILDSSSSAKSDDWFLNALNRGFSDTTPVNCLLDDDAPATIHPNSADCGRNDKAGKQDVHSVPDSPMLETSSSFGSSSSSPSIANLPSIRVRAEEAGGSLKLGMEDQFANMVVGGGGGGVGLGLKQDEGFIVLSSPSSQQPPVAAVVPASSGAGDYSSRVLSDDERSDHGIPIGFRKLGVAPPQSQQRSSGGLDLPSPDSASSESSLTNVGSRQRPVIYQDQVVQLASGMNRVPSKTVEAMINISDPNTGLQLQQHIQDSGMQPQVDPRQHPLQNQQTAPQQQHPFIQAGSHYIHQHPGGTVPVTTYYSVYPPQQPHLHHHPQLDQQYPMYYMPVSQVQAYNLSSAQAQPPNSNDTPKANQNQNQNQNPNPNLSAHPQTPPNPTIIAQPAGYNLNPVRHAPTNKPEVALGGVYRMATSAAPPHAQQQQYVGYTQIHHPSQSIPPASGGTAAFTYDFTNPPHPQQIYYTQQLGPTLSSQYQTMSAAVMLEQHPGDTMKQQIRTSQAQ